MQELLARIAEFQHQKESLTRLLSHDTVTEDSTGFLEMLNKEVRKLKKEAVLKVHANEIRRIYIDKRGDGKRRAYWQTNAPWMKSGKIRKQDETDLYEALYLHYYGESEIKEQLPTVAQMFDKWIEDRRDKHIVEELTLVHNIADWNKYIAGEQAEFRRASFIEKPISEVKISEIIDHYEYIVGSGNVSKNAFTNMKSVINGAFGYAIAHDINCVDPRKIQTYSIARRCKPPKDNDDEYYTQEDKSKLLTYLETLPKQTTYSLAARLILCMGARIGEYRALHWDDYDVSTRMLYFHRQMTDVPMNGHNRVSIEQDHMKGRTSAGKRRIPVSDYAAQVLEELRKITGNETYILNSDGEKPITTNKFNENLRRFCKAVGVQYKSSHKTRFGLATGLYAAGVDEKVIQTILGHSSVTTTRHYDRRPKNVDLSDEVLQSVMGREKSA